MSKEDTLAECQESLERIQTFDANELGREQDLGRQLSFVTAVPAAEAIIAVYKRIPLSAIPDLTESQLSAILGQSRADYNTFKQVLDFSAAAHDAANIRLNLINTLNARRDAVFDQLWQYIAYGVARTTDTSLLEAQARAAIQGIRDESATLTKELKAAKVEADNALSAIKSVASEHGVSQTSIHFKEEAQAQEALAATWLTYTYRFAIALGSFAALSLFLHKIPWISPNNATESFQLISSKILIFAVLGYLLVMASRNYGAYKHNAVVNRHRQNALLTYRALVAAAEEAGTQDIVLAHAASCIFAPQETGFTQSGNDSGAGSKSVLELFTKGATKAE